MASKRNQHYIPQYYLRNFSINSKSVCCFNIARHKPIETASIKGQCKIKYFYGKIPTIENALNKHETLCSKVIKTIIRNQKLPERNTFEHRQLLRFIAVQHGRTKNSADVINEMVSHTLKQMAIDSKKLTKEQLKDVKIELNDPVLLSLNTVVKTYPLLLDLKYHMFINHSKISFITSDNPIIFYNEYTKGIEGIGCTGFTSVGLLIFVPLSPKILLLFYDPVIYKVGDRKLNLTSIHQENDIFYFNLLQYLNAYNNIYFRSYSMERQIFIEFRKIENRRHKNLIGFSKQDFKKDGGTEVLLHYYKQLLNIESSSRHIRIHNKYKKISFYDRLNKYRNNELHNLVQELAKEE